MKKKAAQQSEEGFDCRNGNNSFSIHVFKLVYVLLNTYNKTKNFWEIPVSFLVRNKLAERK